MGDGGGGGGGRGDGGGGGGGDGGVGDGGGGRGANRPAPIRSALSGKTRSIISRISGGSGSVISGPLTLGRGARGAA